MNVAFIALAMSNYLIGLQALHSQKHCLSFITYQKLPEKLSHINFQLNQMTNYIKSSKNSSLYKNPQGFSQFMFDHPS